MRIEYDKEVDAQYILLRNASPVDTRDVEEGVPIDLNKDGHIIGIEILEAHRQTRSGISRECKHREYAT